MSRILLTQAPRHLPLWLILCVRLQSVNFALYIDSATVAVIVVFCYFWWRIPAFTPGWSKKIKVLIGILAPLFVAALFLSHYLDFTSSWLESLFFFMVWLIVTIRNVRIYLRSRRAEQDAAANP